MVIDQSGQAASANWVIFDFNADGLYGGAAAWMQWTGRRVGYDTDSLLSQVKVTTTTTFIQDGKQASKQAEEGISP